MSRINDLLKRVQSMDPNLGSELLEEVREFTKRRTFGLVFEPHQPEAVELPQRRARKGDKVRTLPPRGCLDAGDKRLWRITAFEGTGPGRSAHLIELGTAEPEQRVSLVEDLTVVAEFNDRIYPGLVQTGRVELGGDKPFHTVINAENFHALELLTYTHRHSLDAIYIDPPYNTGAKDWKYNNDYVEKDDGYRHSKWLAFMERRLKIARELLKPDDSVLIVTIDEKEYLRLGLLLEQTFPEADVQMVSAVINRAGSSRAGRFARVDEYIFYVFFGAGQINPWTSTMLDNEAGPSTTAMPTVWFTAVRRGTASAERSARPALFYPVIIDSDSGSFLRVGDPLSKDADREEVHVEPGAVAIWPLSREGREQTWRFSAARMREFLEAGTARLGKQDPLTRLRPVTYLQPGTLENIKNGTFLVAGRNSEGALELQLAEGAAKLVTPRSVWDRTSHFARDHGSHMLKSLLGEKRFDFPKSLYAVEDTLRFVLSNKPDAVVLDFFSGSGTTAHGIMRLNKQDGGRRQCISVTNNEVSAEEQAALRREGLRPGDPHWETLGICDYVTKPRIEAAITGRTPQGKPIVGDYKFTDEFPMAEGFDENAVFFTLTYEGPLSVAHHRAFNKIAPLLWLRAGSQGRRIDTLGGRGWDVAETYGVLENLDNAREFVAALADSEDGRIAYIVTDDGRAFQMVCSSLPTHITPVRLYESYLTNFEINSGRKA